MPPLNAYSPISGGLSGYSDWVIQCANEIYPIVGISYMGHKLQLLALLTFLEEEHRNEEFGIWSPVEWWHQGQKGGQEFGEFY